MSSLCVKVASKPLFAYFRQATVPVSDRPVLSIFQTSHCLHCRLTSTFYISDKPLSPLQTDWYFPYFRQATVCLLIGCLTSQQHASVSQGQICSENFTCCHTEIEVADQTFYLTQSQYTDTGPTSPITEPIRPCACQGGHRSAIF